MATKQNPRAAKARKTNTKTKRAATAARPRKFKHTGPAVTPRDVQAGAAHAICEGLLKRALDVVRDITRAGLRGPEKPRKPFVMPPLRPDDEGLLLPPRKAFLYHAAIGTLGASGMSITYNVPELEIMSALMELAMGAEIDPKDLDGVNWPKTREG